jgi:hypothetical protein
MKNKGFSIWDRTGGLSESMRWGSAAVLTLVLFVLLGILFNQDSQKKDDRPAMVISLPDEK